MIYCYKNKKNVLFFKIYEKLNAAKIIFEINPKFHKVYLNQW